jgi:predicted aspartyl protease
MRCSILIVMFSIRLAAADLDTVPKTGFSEIPIRLAGGFAPVAAVWVGGEGPFDFLIDTGTDAVLIDPALARQFPAQPLSALALDSLNGSARVSLVTLPSLRLGGETISPVEAVVNNLDAVHRLSARIRGVIGFRLLRRFSFEIDYAKSRLALWEPGLLPPPVAGVLVPAVSEDRIVVPSLSPAARNGSWNLALDSGVAQPLIFSERLREARYDGGSYLLSTNAAQTLARSLRLDELEVGGMRWHNVAAVTMNGSASPQNNLEDGLLPACAFAAIRFELPTARAVLVPRGRMGGSACSP